MSHFFNPTSVLNILESMIDTRRRCVTCPYPKKKKKLYEVVPPAKPGDYALVHILYVDISVCVCVGSCFINFFFKTEGLSRYDCHIRKLQWKKLFSRNRKKIISVGGNGSRFNMLFRVYILCGKIFFNRIVNGSLLKNFFYWKNHAI